MACLRPTAAIEVERVQDIRKVLLFRGWTDGGEHSDKYCVELQFQNKKTAISWLRRHKLQYEEVADHEALP